jgi:chaperone BCS1
MDAFVSAQSAEDAKRFGMPRRTGILLAGKPGCGKTSLIMALASNYNYDLHVLSLSGLDGSALVDSFGALPSQNARVLIALEDVDCLFRERSQSDENPGVTFSDLINCLDGLISSDNVVLVMTTNKPKLLDSALTRPGRIDLCINVPLPTRHTLTEAVRWYWTDRQVFSEDNVSALVKAAQTVAHLSMAGFVRFLFKFRNDQQNALTNVVEFLEDFVTMNAEADEPEHMYR